MDPSFTCTVEGSKRIPSGPYRKRGTFTGPTAASSTTICSKSTDRSIRVDWLFAGGFFGSGFAFHNSSVWESNPLRSRTPPLSCALIEPGRQLNSGSSTGSSRYSVKSIRPSFRLKFFVRLSYSKSPPNLTEIGANFGFFCKRASSNVASNAPLPPYSSGCQKPVPNIRSPSTQRLGTSHGSTPYAIHPLEILPFSQASAPCFFQERLLKERFPIPPLAAS